MPLRLVFDNATGVGRKASDTFRATDMFGAFAARYGFSFSFCNPNSGHEKGNVERKACFIRNSLFVPVPVVANVESCNRHLPDRCMALSKGRAHWLKGEPEDQLFVEDRFALSGLPAKPFEVVKYVEPKTDKQGRFRLDGVHAYSTAPSLASARIAVGVTAHKVKAHDAAGAPVCEHARAYGDAPTDSEEPASQLALPCTRPNAWANSHVRASLPEALRAHMDSLPKSELRAELRVMRNQAASSGYGATVDAMSASLAGTGRIDEAGVALAAARAASGTVTYEDRVDLGAYDAAFASIGGWRDVAVRSKDDAQAFRDAARCLSFSNATVDEFLAAATAAQMRAVLEFIGMESGNRAAAKHAKLVRKAKFDEVKSFAGYDFSNVMFPEGYGADDMRSLSFVEAEQDFVFYGQTGRGKAHCAEALGMEAVNAGYEVRFFTVANLVLHLQKLKADGKLRGFMKGLQSARLVILDEFGYVPIDIEGSRLLYQVVAECMKGRSLIITANIEFGKWGTVLGDDKMAAAIVDRLVEHGRLVELTGASRRMEHALMLGNRAS